MHISAQVANCSETVSPILAQSLALVARQSLSSTFAVYVQSPLASNLSCLVTLLDSQVGPTPQRRSFVSSADCWVRVSSDLAKDAVKGRLSQDASAWLLEKGKPGSWPAAPFCSFNEPPCIPKTFPGKLCKYRP